MAKACILVRVLAHASIVQSLMHYRWDISSEKYQQNPSSGYHPSSGSGGGYPPSSGYPSSGGGGGGYPPSGGYPPPAQQAPSGGYPPSSGGYPPFGGGYPPSGGGYPPPSGGYPPSSGGYPPSGGGGSPSRADYSPTSADPVSAEPLGYGKVEECSGHETVCPVSDFDADADCEELRQSMRGAGTDENALIGVIASRSNAQRGSIRSRYKQMFGKDLMSEIKSELSGNLEEALLALMEPSVLYMAQSLRHAMRGAGTDEETLIDIMATLSNSDMRAVASQYRAHYGRDLEKDCVSETSGHFKRLLVAMAQANRDESDTVDLELAKREATDLYEAGEAKLGTDESRFNVVLASRNFKQLQATFEAYLDISGRDILSSIDREVSGDLKAGFRAIVMMVRNPASYFSERLYKSLKGGGTDDSLLIRIIVERSEIDLQLIKQEFLKRYQKSLYRFIEGDCSGDYKKLLLAIIGKP